MSQAGTLTWFAQHETRLAWRDAFAMMTGGRADRGRKVAIGILAFQLFIHAVAYFAIGGMATLALENDLPTLIAVTVGVVLAGSAVLSQAMESVTRTFYSRSDLDLILSSPAQAHSLFAVRIGAIAVSVGAMSLLLIGPFINVLAWLGGVRWLGAYGVILAVALTATALAIVLTVGLFKLIGPKRTRLVAQIAAAVIGGLFAVGLQMAALFSTGTMSRLAFLHSDQVLAHAPGVDSALWWPARAALGDVQALILVVIVSLAGFVLATVLFAPRFANFAVAASGVSHGGTRLHGAGRAFRVETASAALRRKERLLILRDPWLISQSLMQLLYLLPPAALLWNNYAVSGGAAVIVVPVLVMASGQLAGALAWLTISGEDAPDLVLTAPVAPSRLLRAKVEAVMDCIAVVFCPFVIALAFISPGAALVAACAIAASAASASAIQLWFRSQAKRSQLRRRHSSSRIATLAEALSSITWAAAGAIAAAGSWLAVFVVLIAIGIVAGVRYFSPARAQG
ncbi:MAG: permease [Alphaproteobacteria bacterium]|nr:permease [Alphaproteobacteria bacterium]